MAPDLSAAARVYAEIKHMILSGRLPVRTRIEIEPLARTLGVSSMPVRQALSQLAWERLVRAGAPSGYVVALWSEQELAALYKWRGQLLSMIGARAADVSELLGIVRAEPYPDAFARVMRVLEEGANNELRRAARSADDRLHLARAVEPDVIADATGELAALVEALATRQRRAKALVSAFHRKRANRAALLRQRAALRGLPDNGGRR